MARIECLHKSPILCVRMEITTLVCAMQSSEIWLKIAKRQTFCDMDEMGNNCLYYILSRQQMLLRQQAESRWFSLPLVNILFIERKESNDITIYMSSQSKEYVLVRARVRRSLLLPLVYQQIDRGETQSSTASLANVPKIEKEPKLYQIQNKSFSL